MALLQSQIGAGGVRHSERCGKNKSFSTFYRKTVRMSPKNMNELSLCAASLEQKLLTIEKNIYYQLGSL